MRERLTTLACALGALLVFGTLFLRTGVPGERDVPAPTTIEAKGNGLLGLVTWLREEGIRPVSLRERFGALARRHDIPATGNLLVVTLPAVRPYRTEEASALDKWVRAGNTVLLLAALSDRPDWANGVGGVNTYVSLLSGLDTMDADGDEPEVPAGKEAGASGPADADSKRREWFQKHARDLIELPEPQRVALLPNRPHPYLEGVRQAVALSDYPPTPRVVKVPRDGFVLALAHEAKGQQGVLWVRPLGEGTVIVSGLASLFTNRALGLADNARLFANIVAHMVHRGAAVIFDDEHQGLSVVYDPDKFYRDGRLYGTLAIIALAWLVWVLGGTQLQAAPLRSSTPRETELVRATGLYLARVLRPAAAARRLIDNFLLGSTPYARAGHAGQEPWQRLETHPRLARADIAQLRAWHEQAGTGAKVPLIPLRNLIVRIERQLNA
ncbi:MAG: DUF4350 domain-containing protein [Proteobacteria bacterium]|nr:DUF4350 domain-containing protein [Pseudomonadota bacterium]